MDNIPLPNWFMTKVWQLATMPPQKWLAKRFMCKPKLKIYACLPDVDDEVNFNVNFKLNVQTQMGGICSSILFSCALLEQRDVWTQNSKQG